LTPGTSSIQPIHQSVVFLMTAVYPLCMGTASTVGSVTGSVKYLLPGRAADPARPQGPGEQGTAGAFRFSVRRSTYRGPCAGWATGSTMRAWVT
jgi:hypothetical protein